MDVKVDIERLKKNIAALAEFGQNPGGGISRPSFSTPDLEARGWLKELMHEAGLEVRQDGAGNIFGRLKGEGKSVMAGSHIDSVINGGRFDGPAGVLAAVECLRRIKEENIPVVKPLEAASFTDEEGNLVGDFLGSRAFIGALDRELLEKGITPFGVPFPELLQGTDFTVDSILEAHAMRPGLEAFLEIHIEQGPVLEAEDVPIGIVDRIAGKNDWMCFFLGKAGHAGTTPFELRRDALLGLSDFALKATRHAATQHYGSMVTIGRVHVHPGTYSVIPGRVDFSLDFRSTSKEILEILEMDLLGIARDVAAARGLEFNFNVVDKTEPVVIPEKISDLLKDGCKELGYSSMILPSGAGHDAQTLAGVTDSGMIFIPCKDGSSHSPDEDIEWDDLEKAANLLLHTLVRLAG